MHVVVKHGNEAAEQRHLCLISSTSTSTPLRTEARTDKSDARPIERTQRHQNLASQACFTSKYLAQIASSSRHGTERIRILA
jgi:hypothetical protein